MTSSMMPAMNTPLNFGRRHEDARKSSSSESSSPLMPGLSGGIPNIGIPGSFPGGFLPPTGLPGAPHLLPPPLLLMPSSVSGTPTSSPPISSSSPDSMQTSNKLLVRPHPHRFMPTSSQIPSIPLTSNPYFNIQDNLESYGRLKNLIH